MRLRFKTQQYQTDAVEAVLDCFAGQPKTDGVPYHLYPNSVANADDGRIGLGGQTHSELGNGEIKLSPSQLLENFRAVQRRQHLPLSKKLEDSKAALGVPNLDIEMETGTGKTYVYIKTMMELHQRYGWSKFIVVVPSVAIREGVKKSFNVTADHFQQLYGTKPRAFIYNSSQLHELERYSSDAGVQVMIINIQAFNARRKDQRRIFEELDAFQSRRPIDVIKANRPIVIIDEPQKMSAVNSQKSLAEFNALMILRYSATHLVEHNKIHRLDAVDAYNQKLVKRIAVRGITVKGLGGTVAYLYLDRIDVKRGQRPAARIEIEVQTKSGPIRRQFRRVTSGSRLHELANGLEAYRGLVVTEVDAVRDVIELSNGDVVVAGQLADRDATEETKRRIQIREVIRAHLDKERELFGQGIKALSLFFIDEVAKYRDYMREDSLGEYARVFEEEYALALGETIADLELDAAGAAYREFLLRDKVSAIHEGYFSIDKKTNEYVNPAVAKRGAEAGQSTDVDAYELILKNKERLLSFEEPVRFIFSHSALREGWDNPNIFVMGMLKKSDSTISRRQEIGRGLRLAVDQHGERMDNPANVHNINELTVVTDESYTAFVSGLQSEIAESLTARPRKAKVAYFEGKSLEVPGTDERMVISNDQAKRLKHWLTINGFIDHNDQLTSRWQDRAGIDIPPLPAGLDFFHYQVAELIDALVVDLPFPVNGRKPKRIPLNESNFSKREFQELWGRINHKAAYQVEFDSADLVGKCVTALDQKLQVAPLQYMIEEGIQRGDVEAEDLAEGSGFEKRRSATHTEEITASSRIKYDLLREITERTQLTRRTASKILQRIHLNTFAKYRQNPEQFITEAARLIEEQLAAVIVEHLSYYPLAERNSSAIFTENQSKQDLANVGTKLSKHVYDYVVTDSEVERQFVAALDTSAEVAVYAKLPKGFSIPTPVGDYNPDWAIAFRDGTVEHVHFVAETKGSLSPLQLRGVEDAKIQCARKFFASLASNHQHAVKYGVVTDYEQLMQLAAGLST